MNFLADESVDRQIVELLRQDGYSVDYVAEMNAGICDDAVVDLADKARTVLITADKDFGEIVFRRHLRLPGVVLLRLSGLLPSTKGDIVLSAVREHADMLANAFTVISSAGIRIRRKSH